MKNKKLLIALPLLMLLSCNGNTGLSSSSSASSQSSNIQSSISSTSTSSSLSEEQSSSSKESESSLSESSSSNDEQSSSTEELSSSSISESSSSSSSSEEEELKLLFTADGEQDADGNYLVKVFTTMQLNVSFNKADHNEEVTLSTKEGFFGASSNVSIDENHVLKGLSHSDVITVTATASESKLTASIKVIVYAEMDNYDSSLSNELKLSLEQEKNALSSGEFEYIEKSSGTISKETTANYKVFSNTSLEATEFDKNNKETYIFSGMYNNEYYNVKKNSDGSYISARKSATDLNDASKLYQVVLSSFDSFYGISKLVNNFITGSSHISAKDCYNNATVKVEESNGKNYTISSIYNTNISFTDYHIELTLKINFNQNNQLMSFEYNKLSYDNTGYDFANKTLKDGASPKSEISTHANLTYGNREASSTKFSPKELFVEDYDVVIKDKATGTSGTSFEVDTILSYEYGANVLPETAYVELDKLTFVSSSNTSVISLNDKGELVCLAEGTALLKFASQGGVEKEVEITVTYPGVKSVSFNDAVLNTAKVKVGESLNNISAYCKPTLTSQVCDVTIESGSEFATLTHEEDGTYTLTGVKIGDVVLKATTTYNGQEFSSTHTISIYDTVDDATLIEFLKTSTFEYVKTDVFGGTTNYSLSFAETTAKFTVSGSSTYEISFDWSVANGLINVSNVVSSDTKKTITSVEISDDLQTIKVAVKTTSMFGTPTTETFTLSVTK